MDEGKILKSLNIFVGPFGTGKTETAVNFSLSLSNAGHRVTLVDLDIINPYFRSREAVKKLGEAGVKVIAPEEKLIHVDIPGISPVVGGLIDCPPGIVVLDIGGDDLGATVLGRFHDKIGPGQYSLFFVVNPYRPSWSSIEDVAKLLQEVERASRLKVTGLVSNAHLLKDTDDKVVVDGHRRIEELSGFLGLPVAFAVTEENHAAALARAFPGLELLIIRRFMLPPWEQQ